MNSTTTTFTFNAAAGEYAANPNTATLVQLHSAVLPLVKSKQDEQPWIPIESPDAMAWDFYEVRVVCDRCLTDEEIWRLSGCLGYALRCTLAGESLSDPSVINLSNDRGTQPLTVLEYGYDSTKSRRDDPDYAEAFEMAREIILAGSPVRTTNRAGIGTKGTRLAEGIGECGLEFYVR